MGACAATAGTEGRISCGGSATYKELVIMERSYSRPHYALHAVGVCLGRLKMREWKKRYGQNCKGGKCRSKPYGTPIRDFIETTLSYFVILILILVT